MLDPVQSAYCCCCGSGDLVEVAHKAAIEMMRKSSAVVDHRSHGVDGHSHQTLLDDGSSRTILQRGGAGSWPTHHDDCSKNRLSLGLEPWRLAGEETQTILARPCSTTQRP